MTGMNELVRYAMNTFADVRGIEVQGRSDQVTIWRGDKVLYSIIRDHYVSKNFESWDFVSGHKTYGNRSINSCKRSLRNIRQQIVNQSAKPLDNRTFG